MDLDAVALRYAQLAQTMSETVAAVPRDRWDAASPCPDWTAREVLGHVVDLHARLLTLSAAPTPSLPSVADDPVGAWEAAADAASAALDDPEVALLEFDSQLAGPTTLAAIFGTFGAVDLVVHRWDLARATGVDETIAPDDLAFVWDFVKDKGDLMRSPGGFGPALEVPVDAGEQERVLAFLGRG